LIAWGVTGLVALLLLAATVGLAMRGRGEEGRFVSTVPPLGGGLSPRAAQAEATPAQTPGGETPEIAPQIALISDRDGQPDLYLMEARPGGSLTRLTDTPDWEDRPAWSPDGQWLAFSRGSLPAGITSMGQEGFQIPMAETLNVIKADGSGERVVTDLDGWMVGLAWSPDGSRIAVHLLEDQNKNGRRDDASTDRSSLWVVDVASGAKEMVAGGVATWSGFGWAAGGDQLVYTMAAAGPPRLDVVSVDDGVRTHLTHGAGHAAVSPDGQRVAYVSFGQGGDRQSLHVMRIDGSDDVPLLGGAMDGGWVQDLAWSPDGRRLLFQMSERDKPGNLFLLDVEEDEPVNMTADLDPVPFRPRWSPDGDWVVFEGIELTPVDEGWQPKFPIRLYLLDVADGEISPLTKDEHNYGGAAWRPGR